MWHPRQSERLYPMTEQLPQRPHRPMRSRLLTVTGAAVLVTVVGSLLVWHTQLGDFLSPEADKEPVVSGLNAPSAARPTTPKPKPTVSPKKPTPTKPAPRKTSEYGEQNINALSPKLRARLKKAI